MSNTDEIGDAKFEEQREERLTQHYDRIIGVGYFVKTPHGEGEVVGYEILDGPNMYDTTTTKPAPGISHRYMIKLSPGHTWLADHPFYYAFDNEVHMLLGQF